MVVFVMMVEVSLMLLRLLVLSRIAPLGDEDFIPLYLFSLHFETPGRWAIMASSQLQASTWCVSQLAVSFRLYGLHLGSAEWMDGRYESLTRLG